VWVRIRGLPVAVVAFLSPVGRIRALRCSALLLMVPGCGARRVSKQWFAGRAGPGLAAVARNSRSAARRHAHPLRVRAGPRCAWQASAGGRSRRRLGRPRSCGTTTRVCSSRLSSTQASPTPGISLRPPTSRSPGRPRTGAPPQRSRVRPGRCRLPGRRLRSHPDHRFPSRCRGRSRRRRASARSHRGPCPCHRGARPGRRPRPRRPHRRRRLQRHRPGDPKRQQAEADARWLAEKGVVTTSEAMSFIRCSDKTARNRLAQAGATSAGHGKWRAAERPAI
jgi:hypothetical protein